jgi:CheY-like chemotaxis protein
MQERGLDFVVKPPAGPVWLEADPARLSQVLDNLLDNAAKYTDPGGRVELSAARELGSAVLRVADTGMGISPDLLPHIFDLFTQADRSLDRERGGLGVGLTLVKSLVTLQGGTIEAHSDGAGRGAAFVVRLPALAEPFEAPPEPARPPGGGPRLRVLVVDDNPDTAVSLAMLLNLHGHEAETAHDGIQAVEAVRGQPFDAVVLDLGLPGIDGYEAARRIREIGGGRRPLLIAVSGYGFEAARARAREVGFDHHLVKPVDVAVILELLPKAAGAAG